MCLKTVWAHFLLCMDSYITGPKTTLGCHWKWPVMKNGQFRSMIRRAIIDANFGQLSLRNVGAQEIGPKFRDAYKNSYFFTAKTFILNRWEIARGSIDARKALSRKLEANPRARETMKMGSDSKGSEWKRLFYSFLQTKVQRSLTACFGLWVVQT